MGRILVEKDIEAAVKGGSVYAAGGGGWADHGRMLGRAAVNAGRPELVSIDELDDDDWVATAAAIGAPASTTPWEMWGIDYVKAAQLLQKELGAPLRGLIIGQNGKSSTLNAWLPSAILGTKVVDAAGMYATPGFMDGHIHVESSMMNVREYAKTVIPCFIYQIARQVVKVLSIVIQIFCSSRP